MKEKRHTTEEIIKIPHKTDGEQTVEEFCREVNIREQTFYRWRRKHGRMEIADAKRFRELENGNSELKKIVGGGNAQEPRAESDTGKKVGDLPRQVPPRVPGKENVLHLSESRVVIADCRQKFNEVRPHRSLGMRTRKEFTAERPPRKQRVA